MKQIGKQGKLWLKTRKQWLRDNPPNFQGYYQCYICNQYIPQNEVTLDHVKPRSKNPELRYDSDNLKPCCYVCNNKKGSL